MQTLFERYFKTLFELHEIDCWPDFCNTLNADQKDKFLGVIDQINQRRQNEARHCFWDGAQLGAKLGIKLGTQLGTRLNGIIMMTDEYEDMEEIFLEEL